MIPKVIYYAWFGKKELPSKVKENIATWKKSNPTYRIKRIDETNFDINLFSFTKKAYEMGKWAFVSDVARLYVIFNNGGFYFDTDVQLRKSLDGLRNYKSIWGMENSNAINSGLIIGAEKGDKNIDNILSIYKKREFNNNNSDITVSIITNYFIKKGFRFKNKVQELDDGTVIFPTEYFAPLHWWGGGRITDKTIAIHNYSATWIKKDRRGFMTKIRGYIDMELLLIAPSLYFKLQRIKHKYLKIK